MKNYSQPIFLLKMNCLLLAIFFSFSLKAQNYMVDLSEVRLDCIKQIPDDLLDMDGEGNELFIQNFLVVLDTNGNIRQRMVNAALNLKNVKTDASVSVGKTLFGKYPLQKDDILIIIPVLWEEDRAGANVITSFNSNMNTCIDLLIPQLVTMHRQFRANLRQRESQLAPGDHISPLEYDRLAESLIKLSWHNFSGLPSFKTLLDPVYFWGGTRPVGMNSSKEFVPQIITYSYYQLVDYWFLSDLANGYTTGFGKTCRFEETGTDYPGHFSLTLIGNRTLAAPAPPPPPPANTRKITSPVKIKEVNREISTNKPAYANVIKTFGNFNLVGIWTGTQTDGQGLSPMTFQFELTDQNGFLMKDVNGVLAAQGTYNFSNNVFSGSYRQFSTGETFSFTGTYDPATKKLTGTIGVGSSTTNQGKWEVTKS